MSRKDDSIDDSVSRRAIIRSAAVAGISTIGLTSVASAHDDEKSEAENATGTEDENATGKGENATEPEDETDEEAAEGAQPSITFTDQATDGDTVVAKRVCMPEGGFVSIHDRRRFDGEILPSIIGITDFLEPGVHHDVSVPFFTEHATAPGPIEGQDANGLTESQPLIAIPHRDADGSGAFSGEPNPDPAYKGPGELPELGAVNDIASAFVEGSDSTERDEAKAEELDARRQFSG